MGCMNHPQMVFLYGYHVMLFKISSRRNDEFFQGESVSIGNYETLPIIGIYTLW